MRFYVLLPETGHRFSQLWAFGELVNAQYTHGDSCPVCGRPVNMLKPVAPHLLKMSSPNPKKWGDFLWGAGFTMMVSDRVVQAIKREGLTGLSISEVPAITLLPNKQASSGTLLPVPSYFLANVQWNGANQDDSVSEVVCDSPPQCSFCRTGGSLLRQSRIEIESGSWTGLDFFTPRGAPVEILISERAKEVIQRTDLTNVFCAPAGSYNYDRRRPGGWRIID